jgi:Uncharacterized protein conserved in bacteria
MKTVSVHQKIVVPKPVPEPLHSAKMKRGILTREAKALGHLQSVVRLSEEGKDASQIMVQLKAVENELAAVRREIMKDQVSYHLLAAKKENDTASIDALNELLKSWMK